MHTCITPAQKQAHRATWERVHAHEITRRLRHFAESPEKAAKFYSKNAKPHRQCDPNGHVWVPAINIWIHDKGRNSVMIGGIARRGFHEARPYRFMDWQVQPQICWYCDATREVFTRVMSSSQRRTLAQQIASDREKEQRGKPRGRKGSGVILESFDELFEDTVEI